MGTHEHPWRRETLQEAQGQPTQEVDEQVAITEAHEGEARECLAVGALRCLGPTITRYPQSPTISAMSPVREVTVRSLLMKKTQLPSALPCKQRFFKYPQPHRQTTASILSLLSQQQTWESVRDLRFIRAPDKDRDGCPKIVNLGSSKTDLFYEHKKYGFKKR
ncbi:hypothetical protein GOP47_0024620 [Adiantum capillus-veneris]|uniref:Uncharacterized protein n=1 Tax=Adiantum capillus-veneris TaxID=13818 RepID=A0A9D4U2G7_ADICA|nr:hypothetical protein GOP47_0024620 [Adiantum capillus-veneris]